MLADEGLEILMEDECVELLSRSEIGRLGVSIGALPAIFPVAYTLVDGDVLFRTGDGMKLSAVRGTVVSFEVDQFDLDARRGWSVLVVGVANEITDDATEEVLGDRLRPWVDGDRRHVIRIEPAMISGRRILGR